MNKVRERCGAKPHHELLGNANAIQSLSVDGMQSQKQKILYIVYLVILICISCLPGAFGSIGTAQAVLKSNDGDGDTTCGALFEVPRILA